MKLFNFKEKSVPRGEYKEDILAMLEAECKRRHEERRPLELVWMLASDFYGGQQYRDISPYKNELCDYEVFTTALLPLSKPVLQTSSRLIFQ